MFYLSAAMAGAFVEDANEMAEQIKALGSNPLKVGARSKEKET
jgi:coenzyme F420-reducing hydrogenase delta subunit